MAETEVQPWKTPPFGYAETDLLGHGRHTARQYAAVTFAPEACPPGLLKAPLNTRGHKIEDQEYRLVGREEKPDGSVRLEFEPV